MRTRLTLSIDKELIEKAKSYARQSGKSVSQLISDYLELLMKREQPQSRPLTPIVESLLGSLASTDLCQDEDVENLSRKAMLLRRAKAKEAAE